MYFVVREAIVSALAFVPLAFSSSLSNFSFSNILTLSTTVVTQSVVVT
jgi:hypothetical protein